MIKSRTAGEIFESDSGFRAPDREGFEQPVFLRIPTCLTRPGACNSILDAGLLALK
jgi:hypothetical protein